MFDRLYRFILIATAAVIGGLSLYWMAPDLTPHIGENGAALWSWFLIIGCGVVAHWLLPKTSLAKVSRMLAAILVSAFAAMLAASLLNMALDFSLDEAAIPQVLLIGFAALVFAIVVYLPIYLVQRKLVRSVVHTYIVAGALIPAACSLFFRPFGRADFEANVLAAMLLGLIGACSAIAFAVIVYRRPPSAE